MSDIDEMDLEYCVNCGQPEDRINVNDSGYCVACCSPAVERGSEPSDAERLRDWIRTQTSGGCRVLSKGDACECPLCLVDRITSSAEYWVSRYDDAVQLLQKQTARLTEVERERDEAQGLANYWKFADANLAIHADLVACRAKCEQMRRMMAEALVWLKQQEWGDQDNNHMYVESLIELLQNYKAIISSNLPENKEDGINPKEISEASTDKGSTLVQDRLRAQTRGNQT